jgi:hypothetical protein
MVTSDGKKSPDEKQSTGIRSGILNDRRGKEGPREQGNNPPDLALCYPDGSMTRWEDRNVECDRSAGADYYGGKPVSQFVNKR